MELFEHPLYREDVFAAAELPLPWQKLRDRTILISGATGLIGSFLVDVLMCRNQNGDNCRILALSRDETAARARFSAYSTDLRLRLISHDINLPLELDETERVDYVLHLASNTHPIQYALQPISTISTNLIGAMHLLECAVNHGTKRFLLASSNEIYGENRGDLERFSETDSGYIDCNTLRAGYPESKRCAEALCQAYRAEKGLDIVIARLTRSFGPSMRMDDSKAVSQFLKKALSDQDIVLKSDGRQYYSFTYMADAVSGLLTVLLLGECGEAYNVADLRSDVRLRELAELIAQTVGRNVRFELPDAIEASGFSRATKARLNGEKLRALGWQPLYDIRSGITRTICILRDLKESSAFSTHSEKG